MFKACKRTLRLERGANFLAHGVALCKDQPSLMMWTTPQTSSLSKLAFTLIMWDIYHLVNDYRPPLELAYKL